MKHLPPDILVTAQLDLLSLVRQHCPSCEMVIVPAGARDEPDIYRCKAASDRHCVVAINTSSCIRNTDRNEDIRDESPATGTDARETES
jgi:hypothetical protein